jgi:tetratricopeptide (TPR) repeat protein
MLRYLLPVLLAACWIPRELVAQCPDGTPPPCARGETRTLPPLDANRIAVLPFRVSAQDTMIGEGVAELIAMEFTGGAGPRAVHMGSVLSSWRSAGGGLRAPLPISRAARLARTFGAGRFVDGSIITVGSRVTLVATLVSARDESTRRLEPVSGPADSLETLVRRLTVGLIAAAGGERRISQDQRLTDSPAALRLYLDGLAAWRRRRYPDALAAFERALAIDSSFASAAYARMRGGLYAFEAVSRWERLAWSNQQRLTEQERIVLRAILGPSYPASRAIDQRLADLEAVRQAPESPDAAYELGDFLWHHGRAAGWADHVSRSHRHFERSVALDSQHSVFSHLLGASVAMGDTGRLRREWTAYSAFMGADADPRLGWFVSEALGDGASRARFERRPLSFVFYMALAGEEGWSRALLEEMRTRSLSTRHDDARNWLSYAHAEAIQGRPHAASASLAEWPVQDGGAIRDAFLIAAAIGAGGDSVAAAGAAARLAMGEFALQPARARAACAVAMWGESHGHPASWDRSLVQSFAENCALMLDLYRDAREGTLTRTALHRADSLVRERLNANEYLGFENILLAKHWLAIGDTARALAAARRVHTGYPLVGGLGGAGSSLSIATSARLAGELADRTGDTATAITAYRHYLRLRREPEPALVAQRDSVRDRLAALERR